MIIVTDAVTNKKVHLASQHVVAVFEIVDGEHAGKTGINLINGSIVCNETVDYVANEVNHD